MNRVIKKIFILVFALALLSAGCSSRPPAEKPDTNPNAEAQSPVTPVTYSIPLTVKDKKISVAVMRTNAELQRGLSGQNKLRDDQGMLFRFENITAPGFWMKDMQFDLDIIWIRGDTIIDITPSVPAPASNTSDEQLPVYYPNEPIDRVLEVNAGWAQQHNITVGDTIKL